jgi:hypothetical protein
MAATTMSPGPSRSGDEGLPAFDRHSHGATHPSAVTREPVELQESRPTWRERPMAKMSPVHSSHDSGESDPKHHHNDDCPHYHELRRNGHVAHGEGGHPLCDWCKTH